MNMLNIAHKKPLKTAMFCTQVHLQFFTVFFHSPTPFARREKLGHYMLIKMYEILKKYSPGNDIFI